MDRPLLVVIHDCYVCKALGRHIIVKSSQINTIFYDIYGNTCIAIRIVYCPETTPDRNPLPNFISSETRADSTLSNGAISD